MQWSPEITKIAPALVKAQIQMKKAAKSSTNPHFKSKYADLTEVYDACKDALHDNEIMVMQGARNELDTYGVETTLLHSSGQWVREVLMLRPSKLDPQGAGSAITYARRYALAAMVGVMQEDDDGNNASRREYVEAPHKPTPPPVGRPLTGPEAVQRAQEIIASGKTRPQANTSQPGGHGTAGDYIVTFGKFKGQKICNIDVPDLDGYISFLSKPSDKPMSPHAHDFIKNAKAHLMDLAARELGEEVRVYDEPRNIPNLDDGLNHIPF